MKDVENTKARDLQKPVPGCMGRMINLFDLSSGMTGTKLLTEKAHRDGPPIFRAMDPIRARQEDNLISLQMAGGLRSSSRKLGGTPMKMLIAKEMSKEAGCNQMPPNIVAKLMGLDTTSMVDKSVLNVKSSLDEAYPCSTLAGAGNYQPKEDWCYDDQLPDEIQSSVHMKEDKDVHSICHKPQKTNGIEDHSEKGRCNESLTEKRMALVRQKFIEAKHLATDEKLIRSKEFQDALEILSSNRDLFLKFLDEPNSLSSKNLDECQNITPLSHPRRITVLKPARIVELQNDKQWKKERYTSYEEGGWEMSKQCWSSSFTRQKAENKSNPTRIVVLKPSLLNSDETKKVASIPIPSPELLDGRDSFVSMETTEGVGSRELSKEITQTLRGSVKCSQRDEALLSSVMSNRCVGDNSSFNRSTNYKEDSCNLSDSETVSPTPQHSCDCSDRLDSPHSVSSLSLASYSTESSVVREAKKRLSERWELVASNDNNREQRQRHRSSSTLGEMLAIPQVNKEEESDVPITMSNSAYGREEDLLSTAGMKDRCRGEKCPGNLSRSKSLPVSPFYHSTGLKKEAPDTPINDHTVPEDSVKLKGGKSTFKEKVASLFFSKSKITGREKSIPSFMASSDVRYGSLEAIVKRNDDTSISSHDSCPEESRQAYCEGRSVRASTSLNNKPKQNTSHAKQDVLFLEKPTTVVNDASHFCEGSFIGHPQALSRSSPIESLARSLSWDGTCSQTSSHRTLKHSIFISKADEEEERLLFVQKLLSSGGFDNKVCSTVFAQWHLLDSPLDPMLLYEFLAQKEEEAKCRSKRSNQKLLFDCINAALLDMGYTSLIGAYPWARTCVVSSKDCPAGVAVTELMLGRVRDWYSSEEGGWDSGDPTNSSLLIDRMVKSEITGKGWAELMWFVIDDFGKEIGGEVLDELVEEALTDFTNPCF